MASCAVFQQGPGVCPFSLPLGDHVLPQPAQFGTTKPVLMMALFKGIPWQSSSVMPVWHKIFCWPSHMLCKQMNMEDTKTQHQISPSLRGDLIGLYNYPGRSLYWGRCWSLLPSSQWQDERQRPQAASGEVQIGYWEKFLHCKSVQALDQAAQGSGGVPIPEGVEKTWRCGTSGHGLAGMGVSGWWLDLMILEVLQVFSNLNDPMILWIAP